MMMPNILLADHRFLHSSPLSLLFMPVVLSIYFVYIYGRLSSLSLWAQNVQAAFTPDIEPGMLPVGLIDAAGTVDGYAAWPLGVIPPSCNVCRLAVVQKHHAVGQIGIFCQRET